MFMEANAADGVGCGTAGETATLPDGGPLAPFHVNTGSDLAMLSIGLRICMLTMPPDEGPGGGGRGGMTWTTATKHTSTDSQALPTSQKQRENETRPGTRDPRQAC